MYSWPPSRVLDMWRAEFAPGDAASRRRSCSISVRDALRVRHYSIRTEEAYVGWIRRFILFHGKRHPREMGKAEITAFLTTLAVQGKVAASTQNQALSALLFLYRYVLETEVPWLDELVHAKRPQKLPVVLTRGEVQALLSCLRGTKWLMAVLLYGSGLRLLECLRLRVKDIVFERGEIVVREGKGGKDRLTMLPAAAVEPLRRQLERGQGVARAGSWRRGTGRCISRTRWPASTRTRRASWRGNGCFPRPGSRSTRARGRPAGITRTSRSCSGRSGKRRGTRALPVSSVHILYATALRHTSWSRGTTFVRFRSCWAMPMSARP